MRTKPGVDTLNFDDLYNNLRVFESDVKGSTGSSSSTQNVAFVSFENTSSTNEVITVYGVSTSFGHNSQTEGSSSYTDDLMYSFFSNQSSGPQLDHEDLEQVDEFNFKEMDLKWQVAMISTRLKKFYKKTGRKLHFDAKEPVGFDKSKVEYFNCHNKGHFARECKSKENQDSVDWTGHAEDETEDYALMAFNSSSSDSYTEMSAKDKSGLGYGSHIHDGVLSYENEVFASVFDSRSSDVADSHVNDRFVKVKGMHTVSPPMTENYMPPKFDFGIDELKFTYGPKQSTTSESDAKTSDLDSCESSSSEETLENVPKQIESKPKVVNEPKVWSDAPIIEVYESDSDDEYVSKASVEQEKASCAFINTVKHVKTPSFSHLIRDCDFHEKIMAKQDNPHQTLKGKGIVDCGCSRHMTGNKAYLVDYQDFNGGHIAFGDSKGQITGKGKIKIGKLDFEDVYFVKELQHFNLFSVSQMYDKKNKVLFTDTECLVLSPDFKFPDKNQVLLRVPRQHKMYNFNLENIVPSGGLACLIAKATVDESTKCNARTPQQNEVTERKNMTLIEAAKTMLADAFLPNTFWAEAVSTACYVLNRVLVTKPQNKTPYELLTGKIPILIYIRPFGYHVTILNTIDHLGKFEEKYDEGFLVRYSLSSKAFRHITAENKSNKTAGPKEANNSPGTQDTFDARNSEMEADHAQEYYVLPLWSSYTSTVKSSKAKNGDEKLNEDTDSKTNEEPVDQEDQAFLEKLERLKRQEKEANDATDTSKKTFAQSTKIFLLQAGAARASSTNYVNTARTPVTAASTPLNTASTPTNQDDSQIPILEDIYEVLRDRIFTSAFYDDEGAVDDFTNLETTVNVSLIPTSRIHSIHLTTQILGDPTSAVQTRSKVNKSSGVHAFVYRNKNDERGVVVRNKARLVAQGHRQEEGIDYDEVFAPVARIEAIRIFLTFASYMGFIVYKMDIKSALLYDKIDEEVYVSQPPGFIDPKFPNKVYKVVKSMYGLHQAPRAWYDTLSTFLVQSGYKRGLIDKTLFIKKDKKDIMLVQVYVDDIIFGSTKKSWCDEFEALMKNSVKTVSTLIKTKKPLVKDEEAADVDVHLYRSTIGSLMYLAASRPDIIYAVCACYGFQITPKTSHLQALKRIFRYLKGQPKLGLWYPRESAFDLEAYSDSDYPGANLDKKSTTRGCQFLGRRIISWQFKKQTIIDTLTTEAEYVAAASCCEQVL
nr:putative ribonuclease H-like domain-containing protein [Tanacetum cinerariifolium]